MKYKDVIVAIFLTGVLAYAICSRAGLVRNKYNKAQSTETPVSAVIADTAMVSGSGVTPSFL